MSIQKNINNLLNKSFENSGYLPKKLLLEDIDQGVVDYLNSLNISVVNAEGILVKVPVIYLSQERWAEFKMNWKELKDESGEEINMPFFAIKRVSVKPGEHPLKRTIPKKKNFTFVRVPIFDGTLKGYDLYKIPQPPRVDVQYELRFLTHYIQDTNVSYERMIMDGFSDGQGYMNINGYYIPLMLADPTEENTIDEIASDRKYQIMFPLSVYGKLVDPINFERVPTITKIKIDITEL
jgi:hypothetical protein